MSQPGRWLRRESELAYDGWCFFAYAHTHGAVRYIQHGAHTVLTDLLLRTNSSNACGVTEREGRAGTLSVAGVLLLLLLLMQLQDDTMALLTVLGTLYVCTYIKYCTNIHTCTHIHTHDK